MPDVVQLGTSARFALIDRDSSLAIFVFRVATVELHRDPKALPHFPRIHLDVRRLHEEVEFFLRYMPKGWMSKIMCQSRCFRGVRIGTRALHALENPR